jgi:hypothetical protein
MSMILLEPANKITHFNVEIKRRTISLAGFAEAIGVPNRAASELAENPTLQELVSNHRKDVPVA